MKRREFITLLGGAAVVLLALPRAARAQQPERMRRILVLISTAADDPDAQGPLIAAFLQGLPASKGPPSSLVQLRTAVWTDDARDTRPICDIELALRSGCTKSSNARRPGPGAHVAAAPSQHPVRRRTTARALPIGRCGSQSGAGLRRDECDPRGDCQRRGPARC